MTGEGGEKKLFRTKSLYFRLFLLVFLAVVPPILVSLYEGWRHKEADLADIREEILSLVQLAARSQEEIITKSTPPLLRLLATIYPEVHAGDSKKSSALFARILKEYPQYINIMAARVPSGDVFASGVPLTKPLNLADRSYFKPIVDSRSYTIGEYTLGKATGRPTLVCGYPVISRDGAVQAIIVAGIDLARLAEPVADFSFRKDAVITLLDRNGKVLFRSAGHEAWVGKGVTGSDIWKSIQNGKGEGSFRGVDYDGKRKLAAFKSLLGANGQGEAYLLASVDEATAVAGAVDYMQSIILSVILSTMLALGAALAIAYRSVVLKVDSLVRTATKLAEGDLDARTGIIGGTEEFVRLAGSFDAMAEKLRAREAEQKAAEQALADEKELLMVTLRSIGDGVITADRDGRVVHINKMAEQLTGWSQEEGRNRPLEEVFHIINEKTRARCQNPLEMVLETGGIVELGSNTALVSKGGQEFIIADSGAPIVDRENRVVGVVLVFRDITEKQRLEEEFIRNERLESLALLAGGVAHDFNNLLSAILGNISLALLTLPSGTQAADKLSRAEQATLQARGLTTQLLSFTTGGSSSKKCMMVEGVISSTAKFVMSGYKSLLDLRFQQNLWPVEIDEGQISQVINNLILNAVQSTPKTGTIRIVAENCLVPKGSIPGLMENRYLKISISGKGEVSAGETLERIFDPYSTTKEVGGGFGLASSCYIVKRHGGCITVETGPGGSSIFNVYLPASSGKAVQEDIATPSFSGEGKRVLVMDDDEMVRDVAIATLEHMGFYVEGVIDGAAALKSYQDGKIAGRPFDAVIMDLTVPGGMGGVEAAQELLRIDPKAKLLASSGYSNDSVLAEYRSYGFCGVIQKPYAFEEMQKIMAEIFRHEAV